MTSDAPVRPPASPALPVITERHDPAGPATAGWVTLVKPSSGNRETKGPLSLLRLAVQLSVAATVLAVLVALAGSVLSRRIAENQAVHEVAQTTDILAVSVVQPALTDPMATDPKAAAALSVTISKRVLSSELVRVKIWSAQGTILYSDETRLIGRTFPLDGGAREALHTPQTRAEITDLSRPENALERSEGKLLEVYRPVWTPDGQELLFETYFRYHVVTDRSTELWRGFAGITLSSVALIFVLLVPIVWTLLRRARRAQSQREELMQRAMNASRDERQRIAADLHDGIVQEIAAASFAVASGAEAAAARGEDALADDLRRAAATVRTSMGGLRSLVVDIYPPTLRPADLPAALRDLSATMAGRGPEVRLDVDDDAVAELTPEEAQAFVRVAQECLRNTVKHADADQITVAVRTEGPGVTLEVTDDGRGFEPAAKRGQHLGLSLMTDVATAIGARLQVQSAPGLGTAWRMWVPTR